MFFAKFVWIILYIVPTSPGQIVRIKFAWWPQKCFCLHDSLDANNSTAIVKQSQDEVKNLPAWLKTSF